MSTRAVTDEQLQAIADAIRLKTDNPAPMSISDMPLQIGLIPTGEIEIPADMGITTVKFSTFSPTVDSVNPTIPHGLDVPPKFMAVYMQGMWGGWDVPPVPNNTRIAAAFINPTQEYRARFRTTISLSVNNAGGVVVGQYDSNNGFVGLNSSGMIFSGSATYYFRVGSIYNVIAMA